MGGKRARRAAALSMAAVLAASLPGCTKIGLPGLPAGEEAGEEAGKAGGESAGGADDWASEEGQAEEEPAAGGEAEWDDADELVEGGGSQEWQDGGESGEYEAEGEEGFGRDGEKFTIRESEAQPKVKADARRTVTFHLGKDEGQSEASSSSDEGGSTSYVISASEGSGSHAGPSGEGSPAGEASSAGGSSPSEGGGSLGGGASASYEAPASYTEAAQQPEEAAAVRANSKLVVIDPGHQKTPDPGTEPSGPGSSDQKAKATSGSVGAGSGLAEYELTLMVAQRAKASLEERGYTVMLTRETNEESVSNKARAESANAAGAAAYVVLHADASNDPSDSGIMAMCNTAASPYNASIHADSMDLAARILKFTADMTGARNEGIYETDSLAAVNWAKVPAVVFEMGYLSNPEEDARLSTPDYREKLAEGVANGVASFLSKTTELTPATADGAGGAGGTGGEEPMREEVVLNSW